MDAIPVKLQWNETFFCEYENTSFILSSDVTLNVLTLL